MLIERTVELALGVSCTGIMALMAFYFSIQYSDWQMSDFQFRLFLLFFPSVPFSFKKGTSRKDSTLLFLGG
jgi:hypothetical protein